MASASRCRRRPRTVTTSGPGESFVAAAAASSSGSLTVRKAARPPSQFVLAAIGRDAVKPGAKGRLPLELRQLPVGCEEDILRHVFGILDVAEEAESHAPHQASCDGGTAHRTVSRRGRHDRVSARPALGRRARPRSLSRFEPLLIQTPHGHCWSRVLEAPIRRHLSRRSAGKKKGPGSEPGPGTTCDASRTTEGRTRLAAADSSGPASGPRPAGNRAGRR